MASKRNSRTDVVPRPTKNAEYEIRFGDLRAEKGWVDLKATAKNALADAYDYLTVHPTQHDANRCYQSKPSKRDRPQEELPLATGNMRAE